MTKNPTQADLDALAPLVDRAHVAVNAERRLRPMPDADPDVSEEATSAWAIESLARSAENWRQRYANEREIVNDLNEALRRLERYGRIRQAAWCLVGLVVGIAAALWWRW